MTEERCYEFAGICPSVDNDARRPLCKCDRLLGAHFAGIFGRFGVRNRDRAAQRSRTRPVSARTVGRRAFHHALLPQIAKIQRIRLLAPSETAFSVGVRETEPSHYGRLGLSFLPRGQMRGQDTIPGGSSGWSSRAR
jgi:hypothetical protein